MYFFSFFTVLFCSLLQINCIILRTNYIQQQQQQQQQQHITFPYRPTSYCHEPPYHVSVLFTVRYHLRFANCVITTQKLSVLETAHHPVLRKCLACMAVLLFYNARIVYDRLRVCEIVFCNVQPRTNFPESRQGCAKPYVYSSSGSLSTNCEQQQHNSSNLLSHIYCRCLVFRYLETVQV